MCIVAIYAVKSVVKSLAWLHIVCLVDMGYTSTVLVKTIKIEPILG